MFDINEVPYAEWLEKSLRAIVPLKPVCLCFAATMPDGEVISCEYTEDPHKATGTGFAPQWGSCRAAGNFKR